MTGRETDEEYCGQLRDNMADPSEGDVATCHLCGCAFRIRCWPSSDDAALAAFLDGLGQLARRTGMTVYGLWMLVGDELSEPGNPEQPCQLWRGNDGELLATTTMYDATARTTVHGCRELN